MLKILVCGVGGKMGSETAKAIMNDPELILVAGVDPKFTNKTIGNIIDNPSCDAPCYDNLDLALSLNEVDVVVDFTTPAIIFENAKTILNKGVHCVIGTTGLTKEERIELNNLAKINNANVLIAPNFSLGAVMMMKISAELAPYFPDVEIIELHHNNKFDAPSGTSKLTAELISNARNNAQITPSSDKTKDAMPGARGALVNNIPIHSIRLPGYVAHQEVLFGGYMETFTLRHDSLHRASFMPGVILACKKISQYPGLTYGLEHYL